MNRIKMIGLALVAAFALGAVGASSASALKNGPHWFVEKIEQKKTENHPINFTSGVTKLKAKGTLIECSKDKGKGEIKGGLPGTDNATIEFEGCVAVEPKCTEVNSPGEPNGKITVAVNSELAYQTKAAIEKETEPLVVVFKTTKAKSAPFVKLQLKGGTGCVETTVEATGEEHGPGIEGKAGVVCEMVKSAETEAKTHEINCQEKKQTEFWYWNGGVATKGKAGLAVFGKAAEQIGKATIELESKELFSARGI